MSSIRKVLVLLVLLALIIPTAGYVAGGVSTPSHANAAVHVVGAVSVTDVSVDLPCTSTTVTGVVTLSGPFTGTVTLVGQSHVTPANGGEAQFQSTGGTVDVSFANSATATYSLDLTTVELANAYRVAVQDSSPTINGLTTKSVSFECSFAPTATPTATETTVPTETATVTPTETATVTPTETETSVPTATDTPVAPTATSTGTSAPTASATSVPTNTSTSVPTATPTATTLVAATATNVPTATATNTAVPATSTPTATNTAVAPTATNTAVPPTATPTTPGANLSGGGAPTPTHTATARPTATNTPRPTATSTTRPTATNTPRPTATNTATPRPTSTATPRPTSTATATSTPRSTATSTPSPTSTPQATATSTPRSTATPSATATPRPVRRHPSTGRAEALTRPGFAPVTAASYANPATYATLRIAGHTYAVKPAAYPTILLQNVFTVDSDYQNLGRSGLTYAFAHDDMLSGVGTSLYGLHRGDVIFVQRGSQHYRYVVTSNVTVAPTNVAALTRHYSRSTLVLVTCTPVGVDTSRVVVTAQLSR